jgi:hypothetical protein
MLHPHTQMYYIRMTKTNIVACFFEARVMKNVLIREVPFHKLKCWSLLVTTILETGAYDNTFVKSVIVQASEANPL